MDRAKIIADAQSLPDEWHKGYQAGLAGKSAASCPHGPRSERKMNAWLSGFVTATDGGSE